LKNSEIGRHSIVSTEGNHHIEPHVPGPPTDKPTVTDEHKEQAKQMAESYTENRPTTVLPGTDGAVAGTAITDWVDDDGNPKYGRDKGEPKKDGQGNGEQAESHG
jgi:hypothetical protein